jgi:hypothetical protein
MYKAFPYLNIHGEFIDHDRDIRESIARAVLLLIQKGALVICSYKESAETLKPYITKEFILANLGHFVQYPKEIEFSFDFTREAIKIRENARIINIADQNDLAGYLKPPIRQRSPALIKNKNTCYSGDYRKTRKSTMYFYDRARKLKEKNNTRWEEIERNPYKTRLEFKLARSNNTRMSLKNIGGTYDEMIVRFTPLLAAAYKKWFDDCVEVQSDDLHPYFNGILESAKNAKKYLRSKDLVNHHKDLNRVPRHSDENERYFLINDICKYKRRTEKKEREKERKHTQQYRKINAAQTSGAAFPDETMYGLTINMMRFMTIYDYQDDGDSALETDGFTLTTNALFYTIHGPCISSTI